MLTTEDFIDKYSAYSDEQILEVYAEMQDYSEEAQDALKIVISKRGGEIKLLELRDRNRRKILELENIKFIVGKFETPKIDIDYLRSVIKSEILSPSELDAAIENAITNEKSERTNAEINSKTILNGVLGGILASIVGGIFFGLQIIYSEKIFNILIFGVVLICYGIVKLFTKKSFKNTLVLIVTVVAVALSFFLGRLLFALVGYQG